MKSNLKRTIAFALTLCAISAGTIAPNAGKFILSPTPITAEAATKIGDFTFTRRSVAAATLTQYVGTKTSVTLPTEVTINGAKCKVTGIDTGAFFRNTNIKSVTIPYGYTSIGTDAFMDCSNLSSVSIPSTICAIRDHAFSGTAISSFTIPADVKILGNYAFNACRNLKTVRINTTILTKLPTGLFGGCTSLTSVNIPSTIKELGDYFASDCKSLTSITLPNGLTTIGEYAFENCTSLSSLNLPSGTRTIGGCAFKNTPWLKKQSKTNGLVIKNGNILDASSAKGSVSIPSGIRVIPRGLFEDNNAITLVSMPSSVEVLGPYAFSSCANLKEVQLSNYISEIPESCFANCSNLNKIILTNRITKIGSGAFSDCPNLTTINFPEHLETVGYGAFSRCTSLNNVTGINASKNYDLSDQAFYNCWNLRKLNGRTVVTRSGYNVSIYMESFVKKYFNNCDSNGIIQDYVDMKTSAVVDQIRNQHPNYTQAQMALALHNWMAANGSSPADENNINQYRRESSVLLNGKGVCVGYSFGYNRLLRKAGIESYAYSGDGHAWNVVKLDGVWFNVDSYWDDNGSSAVRTWFLVSDNEMLKMDNSGYHTKTSSTGIVRNTTDSGDLGNCIIRCEYPLGDVNLDKKVDNADVQAVTNYYKNNGQVSGTFNKTCADINCDGVIDSKDAQSIWSKYSRG